jgi:CBS domain-containing protein
MRCDEAMQRDVFTVRVDDPVREAAALMRDQDLGFLPVVDHHGRAVGTLTDRDIAVRFAPYELLGSEIPVRDIMTAEVVACAPDDQLRDAGLQMRENRVGRVVVLDDDDRPVGVITLTDLAVIDSERHAARTLKRLAEREFRP